GRRRADRCEGFRRSEAGVYVAGSAGRRARYVAAKSGRIGTKASGGAVAARAGPAREQPWRRRYGRRTLPPIGSPRGLAGRFGPAVVLSAAGADVIRPIGLIRPMGPIGPIGHMRSCGVLP